MGFNSLSFLALIIKPKSNVLFGVQENFCSSIRFKHNILSLHYILSINSMLPVLYSHILIAFYLLLFSRSNILGLNITII